MRRFLTCLTVTLLLAGAVLAGLFDTGYGKHFTATTTIIRFQGFSVNKLSILNKSGADVFVTANAATNTLLAASITNAPVIPAGQSYTFDAANQTSIFSVNVATTNATADVYISGF